MRIHKLILFTCMLVAAMLFAEGITALGSYRTGSAEKKGGQIDYEIYTDETPAESTQLGQSPESLQEEEDSLISAKPVTFYHGS